MRNFLIIGAQRSATTYLATILDQHPEIEMAKPLLPEPKYLLQDECANEYLSHFNNPNMICGEKTTSYMYNPEIPDKVKRILPDCQIIVIIRDPVERAISHYSMSHFYSMEWREPHAAFFGKVPRTPPHISMSPFAYLEYGNYIKYIRPYADMFPVKILLYEEIISQKFDELFDFLHIQKYEFKSVGKIHTYPRRQVSSEITNRLRLYFTTSLCQLEDEMNVRLDHWKHHSCE